MFSLSARARFGRRGGGDNADGYERKTRLGSDPPLAVMPKLKASGKRGRSRRPVGNLVRAGGGEVRTTIGVSRPHGQHIVVTQPLTS
jgi:hypothetical protein